MFDEGHITDRRFMDDLADTWSALAALGRQLEPAEWELPTECPGWQVRDHCAHVVGTESALLGMSARRPAVGGASTGQRPERRSTACCRAWATSPASASTQRRGPVVRVRVTGPPGRDVTLIVRAGRAVPLHATAVAAGGPVPTVTLCMPADIYVRLAAGRLCPAGAPVQMDGDHELGDAIVANLAQVP